MNEHIEEEGLKHLEHIEQELEEIKDRTPAPGRAFAYGLWQGAGALLGGILALALLGWALSFFGIIPGFATIAKYFQDIVNNFRR
jgi:predicted lipid-binding transport protein (Tim44 family)